MVHKKAAILRPRLSSKKEVRAYYSGVTNPQVVPLVVMVVVSCLFMLGATLTESSLAKTCFLGSSGKGGCFVFIGISF